MTERASFSTAVKAFACVLAALSQVCHAGSSERLTQAVRPDAELVRVLRGLGQTRFDTSLNTTERIAALHPNFQLVHLLRADLLAARAGASAKTASFDAAASARLDELRAEALVRLRAYDERPADGQLPAYLVLFSPKQRHALVVDASRSRAYLYRNDDGELRLVDDFYTSLGRQGTGKFREGDKRTPLGVYEVVSYIPGRKLPDLYGWGAFPISYPNAWDRVRGRTGSGIWLHGVPADVYARAPRASDGCVAFANADLEQIARHIGMAETPVIIADRVQWVSAATREAEQRAFLRALESWRGDWESRDTASYLAHYARGFRSGNMDFAAWGAHKRKVNSEKKSIRLALENVSVLRSPGEENLVEIRFDQDYRSNNYAERSRKQQFWVLEDGRWKIAYEGVVLTPFVSTPDSFRGAALTYLNRTVDRRDTIAR